MSLKSTIGAIAAVAALAAVVVIGLNAGEEENVGNPRSAVSFEEATAPLEGGAPELRDLRAEANSLLGGEVEAFGARLEELRGNPVVVNKWASWCGPCRFEFPYFQAQAIERGDEVAFLGVDSDDTEAAAETFLRELPLPYPSYLDPDQDIADEFMRGAREFPATAFYDASGELAYVHLGVYSSEDQLVADIERHAE